MSWYTIFYLMSVADGISTFAIWFAVLATIIFIITSLIKMPVGMVNDSSNPDKLIEDDQASKNLNTIWKFATTIMVVFWMLFIMIPERKDMILIVAGGAVGQFVSNDENAQKLPSEVFQYLRKEVIEATMDLDDAVGEQVREELGIKTKEQVLEEIKGLSLEELQKIQETITK